MKLSLILLLGLLGANPAEVAGEDSCACKAEKYYFKIDCEAVVSAGCLQSAVVVGERLGLGSPDCVRARARVHFQACRLAKCK